MKYRPLFAGVLCTLCVALLGGCENVLTPEEDPRANSPVLLEDVARLLACVPLEAEQMQEVHDAACESVANGYDEEYRMRDLFGQPGSGVGAQTRGSSYKRPLRELLREAAFATKAVELDNPDAWLEALSGSDVQIYWPFSEAWDGSALPVITFDPGDDMPENEGYALAADGSVKKVLVTEQMAKEQPVWVVNRNDDAEYQTLEMLRRQDPSWGSGGGDIVVTKGGQELQTLVLRTFTSHRQFDSWFAGASEFWVKLGAVENFTASTEAELRLYEPSITDFMIVVRRGQVDEALPFNAVLVSEWTGQLANCALMILEDDGGTQTTWKCSATVKYNSKSYGFEIELPLRTRDDIVWRGSLTRNYIERNSGKLGHFGDVDLVLELI